MAARKSNAARNAERLAAKAEGAVDTVEVDEAVDTPAVDEVPEVDIEEVAEPAPEVQELTGPELEEALGVDLAEIAEAVTEADEAAVTDQPGSGTEESVDTPVDPGDSPTADGYGPSDDLGGEPSTEEDTVTAPSADEQTDDDAALAALAAQVDEALADADTDPAEDSPAPEPARAATAPVITPRTKEQTAAVVTAVRKTRAKPAAGADAGPEVAIALSPAELSLAQSTMARYGWREFDSWGVKLLAPFDLETGEKLPEDATLSTKRWEKVVAALDYRLERIAKDRKGGDPRAEIDAVETLARKIADAIDA